LLVSPTGPFPPVVLDQVSVSIGGRPILRDVDLDVLDGEMVTLLGPNGSGKSTLVRAVTGLLPHNRGVVRLFGTPLEDFGDWRRLGFVPQRSTATGGVPATVREVVASGRVGRRRLLQPTSAADRRAVDAALEVVGLADRSSYGVSQLSGGQQQRVLIARALAGEPDLLVLDEPTAGVDLPNQQALADALARLKAQGATILLVAHEIGPMAPLIDRSVVMRDGRVVYDGPPLTQEVASHTHQAHDHRAGARHDHAPHVSSPFDWERDHR
jgi:zinc transport system ATP-binding protein